VKSLDIGDEKFLSVTYLVFDKTYDRAVITCTLRQNLIKSSFFQQSLDQYYHFPFDELPDKRGAKRDHMGGENYLDKQKFTGIQHDDDNNLSSSLYKNIFEQKPENNIA